MYLFIDSIIKDLNFDFEIDNSQKLTLKKAKRTLSNEELIAY